MTPTSETLHVGLLGDFWLVYGETAVTSINTPRLQALLAYLVLHRNAPQSRKHLAFLFWPDTHEAQAQTNLRNLLHKLRRALPDADRFLDADGHSVSWRPDAPHSLDVAEFDALAQAATRAELEQAVGLYRGDLLPGCYDDWIASERGRRQQAMALALQRLIEVLEAERNYKTAIGYGLRLRQLDPLNEDTHRTLMRLHAANLDRAGALRAYHTCVRSLKDELGADPSLETRELYERLLQSEAAPFMPVSANHDQPPLVGRQREWQTLQAAWHRAAGGEPGCVILSGDAGIGKTRLAQELLQWAGRQGVTVAAARCYAAEGSLAYAPVVAWLRSPALHARLIALEPEWAIRAARLLPELSAERRDLARLERPGEVVQRQHLFEALARGTVERGKPLLLLLDDIQWCDRDTLEWLHFLLRFDPNGRLLFLGTVRLENAADNPPLDALLTALRCDDRLTEIPLQPFSADETTKLAAQMSRQSLSLEGLAWLHRETEGNPLFIVEMMRSGLALPERLESGRVSLPRRVHGVLQARLAQLSAPARNLAGVAAAIGREFTLPVLRQACEQDEDGLVRSLDELWQRHIVADASSQRADAYDFTHGKLREVAYNSLSAARRRLLHRRIAEGFAAVYCDQLAAVSGEIATHYELAGQFDQAVSYFQRAAEAARQVYAHADAIRFYRRALALLAGPATASQSSAADLYHHLGDTLHWTAQYDDARAAYMQAITAASAGAEAICEAELYRKIGNSWRDQHCYAEALRAYADAERALSAPPAEPLPEWWRVWIQVLLERNMVYYWLGRVTESDELRVSLQPAVERHGAPGQRVVYFQNIMWIDFRRNRHVATAEMVRFCRETLAAQQEADNSAGIPAAQFGVGFALLWSGDPQGALEPLHLALKLAEQTGDVSLQARCLAYLTVAYRQGLHVEEAQRYAARSLETATSAQMPEYVAMARANQGWLAWRAGDFGPARELARAALELWRQLPSGHASAPFQWLALWPLVALALRGEELAPAVDHARALLDLSQQRLPDALSGVLEQAINAWESGAPQAAHTLFDRSVALAQEMHYL